jgi:hypothetical protein
VSQTLYIGNLLRHVSVKGDTSPLAGNNYISACLAGFIQPSAISVQPSAKNSPIRNLLYALCSMPHAFSLCALRYALCGNQSAILNPKSEIEKRPEPFAFRQSEIRIPQS